MKKKLGIKAFPDYIRKHAKENDWTEMPGSSQTLKFVRTKEKVVITFSLFPKIKVNTYVEHNKKGNTLLSRWDLVPKQVKQILENPRTHTTGKSIYLYPN